MKEYLTSNHGPYTFTHMKTKLETYFGDRIVFACRGGKQNVVTFVTNASNNLPECWEREKKEVNMSEQLLLV